MADVEVDFGLNVDRSVDVGVDICAYDSILNVGLDDGVFVGIDVEIYLMLTYILT